MMFFGELKKNKTLGGVWEMMYKKMIMKRKIIKNKVWGFFSLLFLVLLVGQVYAVQDIMQLSFTDMQFSNGTTVALGDLTVEIWDAATGGNLVFNSSDQFASNISSGNADVQLGQYNASNELHLVFSQDYYLELRIDNEDQDFQGQERLRFQSPVGNLTNLSGVLQVDVANQRIGIGTANPLTTLYVIGTFNQTGGDVNFGNGSLFINSSSVGIGTAAPGANLEIFQNSPTADQVLFQIGTSDDSSRFSVDEDGDVSGDRTLNFPSLSSHTIASVTMANSFRLSVSTDLGTFRVEDTGNAWLTGGNFGIGTTTPTSLLHLESDVGNLLNVSNATHSFLFVDGNTSSVGIGTDSPGASYRLNINGLVNATAYVTNGTDYAEIVEKLNPDEEIKSGDIVGIYNGKATRVAPFMNPLTDNADSVGRMSSSGYYVVSGKSAGIIGGGGDASKIIGKSDFSNVDIIPIAFTGQIKTKIVGTCNAGDWVIPTGDGYGKCIDIEKIDSISLLTKSMKEKIGVAWESSDEPGIKLINIAVG